MARDSSDEHCVDISSVGEWRLPEHLSLLRTSREREHSVLGETPQGGGGEPKESRTLGYN